MRQDAAVVPCETLAMYGIHRCMKRTQMYLDEAMSRLLAAESRRRGTTVSFLVREAVAAAYGNQPMDKDRANIIRRVAGVWEDRTDLPATGELVRELRRSTRSARWKGGPGNAQISARQRRHH